MRICRSTNENDAVLQCPQAYNNLLPGSLSSQLDYYTSKVTAADIQGADLGESLALFWHRHQEGAWNKLTTATLSWLSFIPNMLSHLTLLSRLLGNRWKEAPGFWLGLLWQLVTYVQAFCVILDHASTDSHSSPTVMNVQVSCLSPWSLESCNQYSCSYTRVSNRPPADFAIHYNTLRAAKEQPDVTSYIPCILSLSCNWSINYINFQEYNTCVLSCYLQEPFTWLPESKKADRTTTKSSLRASQLKMRMTTTPTYGNSTQCHFIFLHWNLYVCVCMRKYLVQGVCRIKRSTVTSADDLPYVCVLHYRHLVGYQLCLHYQ